MNGFRLAPRIAACLFLIAATPQAAWGDDTRGDARHLRYEVYWGGMHAADFAISRRHEDGQYAHGFRLRTQGILGWYLKMGVSAEGSGRLPASGPLAPETYDVDFTNRWRDGIIRMRFDPDGGGVDSVYRSDPPREDDDEVDVTEEQLRGAFDPLTAFIETVRLGVTGRVGDDLRIPVFDGRRRFDAVGKIVGRERLDVLGSEQDVVRLRLKPVPVAGFKKDRESRWHDRVFDILITDDSRALPVMIYGEGLGPRINLIGECPSLDNCLPDDGDADTALSTPGEPPPS